MTSQDAPLITMLILFTCLAVSCKNTNIQESSNGSIIKIDFSSGDDFSYQVGDSTHFFAPYPFNSSELVVDGNQYTVVTLSRKVRSGSQVEILPLAQFTVRYNDRDTEDVVVAVPVDPALQLFEPVDFSSFLVEQFAYKIMLETWFANKL
ncbi:MAG: hypothetical protein AAFR14_09430, partial [Bacteroidota bacterium]